MEWCPMEAIFSIQHVGTNFDDSGDDIQGWVIFHCCMEYSHAVELGACSYCTSDVSECSGI